MLKAAQSSLVVRISLAARWRGPSRLWVGHIEIALGWCRRIPARREGKGGKQPYLHPTKAYPWCPRYPSPGPGQRIAEIRGIIFTRPIQRLLDEAAERALQETKMGKVRHQKRITPHLLRYSFSRWTLDAGIDIIYLQQQLGHSSLSTTAIYLRGQAQSSEEGLWKGRLR